jgi:hypothetical protein
MLFTDFPLVSRHEHNIYHANSGGADVSHREILAS